MWLDSHVVGCFFAVRHDSDGEDGPWVGVWEFVVGAVWEVWYGFGDDAVVAGFPVVGPGVCGCGGCVEVTFEGFAFGVVGACAFGDDDGDFVGGVEVVPFLDDDPFPWDEFGAAGESVFGL